MDFRKDLGGLGGSIVIEHRLCIGEAEILPWLSGAAKLGKHIAEPSATNALAEPDRVTEGRSVHQSLSRLLLDIQRSRSALSAFLPLEGRSLAARNGTLPKRRPPAPRSQCWIWKRPSGLKSSAETATVTPFRQLTCALCARRGGALSTAVDPMPSRARYCKRPFDDVGHGGANCVIWALSVFENKL